MNAEERQALREKHIKCDHCGLCDGCPSEWPCEVIRDLDKPEPVSETDPKLSECDHALGSDYFRDEQYPYCPKCGEKL